MITPNELYDDLVKRLFTHQLHKADLNKIIFARRGKSARIEALAKSISKAQSDFSRRYKHIAADKPTHVDAMYPSQCCGLQVIDYYLWALQRLYERGEDRFFKLLAEHYPLIMDLDDRTSKKYGTWFTQKKPLAVELVKLEKIRAP